MKLLVHDLTEKEFKKLFSSVPRDIVILSQTQRIHPCIGCFGCWVNTPAYCIIRDDYQQLGDVFSKVSEMILISKCCYGGYSPFVKNVLDRAIPYMLPFFETRNNSVNLSKRYDNRIHVSAHFYGEHISSEEESIASKLVEANTININGSGCTVAFYCDKSALKGVML
ncbi:MAG: hypothetical protein K5930_07460 [Treponemataceae bacterium]|nr:hypothetical protein [Treponemataceae bacterium]